MNLKEIHSNIFKLSKLQNLFINFNPYLNLKVINFENKVGFCNFQNTNIVCYQSKTCNWVYQEIDSETKIMYPECSDDQIKEVLDSQMEMNELENYNNNIYINTNEDCRKLSSFLGRRLNFDCCKSYQIICDNNNIVSLTISSILYNFDDLNFDNMPIFEKMETLRIYDIDMKTLPSSIFNQPKLKDLYITGTGLKEITMNVNSTSPIINIEIVSNKLSTFPSQLKSLPNLKLLNLEINNITLPLEGLSEFPNLDKIVLDNNKLKGQLTISNSKLEEFVARNCEIDSFYYDNENESSSLKTLDLNNNQLNDNIFYNLTIFKNLRALSLENNKDIKNIPKAIEQLESIEYLNLSGLSIKELPSNLFKLIYLKELHIENNKDLEYIPESIDNLASLKKLYLRKNGLKNLPSRIFRLYNLDLFDISYNPNLNVKLINFGKLKISQCFVHGTPISCYQLNTCDNISEIKSYTCTQKEIDDILNSQLELTEKDQLSNISDDCKKLNKFLSKPLNLECCKFKGVICYGNKFITNLKLTMNLFNSINEIDFEKFPYLPKLKTLIINNVFIKRIPKVIFDLPNLDSLTIQNTPLKEIPKNFNTTSPIRDIELPSNRITEFPYHLKDLPNLINLNLYSNIIKGELKEEIKDFPFLEHINISNNNMNGTLTISKTIRRLYASDNEFNSVSSNFFNSLIILDLSNNKIANDVFEILTKFRKLNCLYLSHNEYIDEIPQSIGNLINLNQLILDTLNIKKLPSNIFKLNNLEVFSIYNNPQLTTNIINFGNSTINSCNLENTNISCYQPGTCDNISSSYKLCTEEEINEILQSQIEIESNEIENEYVLTLECKNLYNFLKISSNIYCCQIEGITCDNYGFIVKLIFNGKSLSNSSGITFDKFPYFPFLNTLEIDSFEIDVLSDSIFNIPALEKLIITNSNINKISIDIETNIYLKTLKISGTNIKELPINIFKSNFLNVLELENNPQLNLELINFENSPIENCFFRGTPITCYQPNTCMRVDADRDIKYYKDCSTGNSIQREGSEEKNFEKADKTSLNNLSTDCYNINKFFNKNENTNCCDVTGIKCDIDNNIIELNLNKETISISNDLDFNNFPLLQNLKFLKLRYFYMNSLSSRFFELSSLESLYIWNSNMTTIPKYIDKRSPIQNLDLSNNEIRKFPYQLSNLGNLKYLSLGDNNINEELNDEFSNFKSLEYLNIHNNNFSGKLIVPSSIRVITANNNNFSLLDLKGKTNLLERLYLDNNLFNEKIFNELIKLQNLQWLYLMSNKKIKLIPPIISNMFNIEIIDLKETGIEALPSNFFKLSKLKRLYIRSKSNNFKIIKFINSPIDYCNFDNTPISCIESNTCYNIGPNDYEPCSESVINEIIKSQTIVNAEVQNINDDKNGEIINSEDCKLLKEFLHLPLNTNCCSLENITCDQDNNITKLKLNMNIKDKTDYSQFPILKQLNELEINFANIYKLPSVFFDLPKLQILNINKSNITEISSEINSHCPIEYINLSDNNITKFPYQFEIIPHLKLLNLMNNNITEEFKNKKNGFSSLEILSIDNNHISGELPIPIKIEKITASNNKFNSIPIKYSNNNSLKIIELQGNNFNGDIFNSLIQFKELTYLDLSYNKKIKSIPETIEKLNKLEKLILNETNLKELPYGIFTLSNLKQLYLESSSTNFKIISFKNKSIDCFFKDTAISCYQPDSCSNIDNDIYRSCTSEEINEVKSQFSFKKPELNEISEDCKQFNTFVNKTIDLDCCEEYGISCDQNGYIKKLYINNDQNSIIHYYLDNSNKINFEAFPKLPNIEKLEIVNIELDSIPETFFQLPLTNLILNKNNLTGELPNNLLNFTNIKEINLNNNKLSGKLLIPKTLSTLYAENNNFNSILDITTNDSLEKLYLSGNDFNGDIFNSLTQFKNLKELNLNDNSKIEYIPSTLRDLSKLEILKINGTNIEKFPYELFVLPNLMDIRIGSNRNVTTEIIHFQNSPYVTCDFGSFNLKCYQPSSCRNIFFINNKIRPCTYTEINEINEFLNINSMSNNSSLINNFIYNNSSLINNFIYNNSSLINNFNYNNQELFDNEGIIISGINNGIIKGFEIIEINGNYSGMINEIDSSLFDNNDHTYLNEINTNKKEDEKDKNNSKTEDKNKNKNKKKNKNKNKTQNKYRNDNTFMYIIISIIGINGMIIIVLTLICLLGTESNRKFKYNEINDRDADIVIVEKITLLNKDNLRDEANLSKKNEKNSLNDKKED
jgi:Leucine-rich repeat (LRR) protein